MAEEITNQSTEPAANTTTESPDKVLLEKIQGIDMSYQELIKENQNLRTKFDGDLAQLKNEFKDINGLKDEIGDIKSGFDSFQTTLAEQLEAVLPKKREHSYLDGDDGYESAPRIFSDDSVVDSDKASRELAAVLSKRDKALQEQLSKNQFDPTQLQESFAALKDEFKTMIDESSKAQRESLEKELAEREYRSQVQARMSSMMSAGADEKLLKYAIFVNSQKPEGEQAQWPEEAWESLKKEQPALFAQGDAEQIAARMTGIRKDVPLDLGVAASSGTETPVDEFEDFFTKNVSHVPDPLASLTSKLS